jgi:stage II sporulation protein AA (anti-sigma F factor antagonist)
MPLTTLATARPAVASSHAVGRRTVVSVDREIDIATAPALADELDAALAAGAAELWVDLTATGFMDSSGVHVLVAAEAQARRLNRRLAVICPTRQIRRLLDISGASAELAIYADRAAAHRGG